MMNGSAANSSPAATKPLRLLAVEGGGTKTEWLLAELPPGGAPRVLRQGSAPAGNLKLQPDAYFAELFAALPGEVDRVGLYLAGCVSPADRARLRSLAEARWPHAELRLGNDRDSALAVAFGQGDGIVVISGTGAAVHGRKQGRIERAGGWGQLLGDRGSGYFLAMQALRAVLSHYDLNDEVPALAHTVLRMLALNHLQDLVDWVSQADKMAVAQLSPAVFEAARAGDAEMQDVIEMGAAHLAKFTAAVARRLGGEPLPVRLTGGVFAHQPEYVDLFRRQLAEIIPGMDVAFCDPSGAYGALALVADQAEPAAPAAKPAPTMAVRAPGDRSALATAATEQRNPRSSKLEKLSPAEIVSLFITEEQYVAEALSGAKEEIAAGIELVASVLRNGGRLFYVGAGTSGRLGVLDASEIPPTFGASPELVQGIMAGGAPALQRAVEGAEDQPEAGAMAVRGRGVRPGDVVCGIAASGRTPFVLGALAQAEWLGARTMLITCNPARSRTASKWEVEIDLATGPELVTGSTRLKAGTATKLVLNLLTTGAMIRLGKVRGNSMIDVQISNAKLQDRGARLVAEALGVGYEAAWQLLEKAGWNVRRCIEEEERRKSHAEVAISAT